MQVQVDAPAYILGRSTFNLSVLGNDEAAREGEQDLDEAVCCLRRLQTMKTMFMSTPGLASHTARRLALLTGCMSRQCNQFNSQDLQSDSRIQALTVQASLPSAGLNEVDILTAPQDLTKQHSTCLDDDQMVALLACLRQELTLIQGPPGTGDSFFRPICFVADNIHSTNSLRDSALQRQIQTTRFGYQTECADINSKLHEYSRVA